MEYRDYYATLGVPRDASPADIKKHFRKLARTHHPDVNKDAPEAEARFKELNEAYDVLSDPAKRKLYDQLGADWDKYQGGRQRRRSVRRPSGWRWRRRGPVRVSGRPPGPVRVQRLLPDLLRGRCRRGGTPAPDPDASDDPRGRRRTVDRGPARRDGRRQPVRGHAHRLWRWTGTAGPASPAAQPRGTHRGDPRRGGHGHPAGGPDRVPQARGPDPGGRRGRPAHPIAPDRHGRHARRHPRGRRAATSGLHAQRRGPDAGAAGHPGRGAAGWRGPGRDPHRQDPPAAAARRHPGRPDLPAHGPGTAALPCGGHGRPVRPRPGRAADRPRRRGPVRWRAPSSTTSHNQTHATVRRSWPTAPPEPI